MQPITQKSFIKISDFEWEIPVDFCSDMRVPVRVFASQALLQDALRINQSNRRSMSALYPGWLRR